MQYAVLGDLQFELLAYFSGMEGRFGADYAEHARIEGKPRLQWIGDKLDEWSIKLKFHNGYCDPEAELARLREAQSSHAVLPFVLANGDYKGEFVITEVSVTSEQTDRQGQLTALDATVSIKEFVAPGGAAQSWRQPAASAVQQADKPLPPTVQKRPPPPSRMQNARSSVREALGHVRTATTAFGAAKNLVTAAKALSNDPSTAIVKLGSAATSLDVLARSAERAGVSVGQTTSILKDTAPVLAATGNVAREAREAKNMIDGVAPASLPGRLDSLHGSLGRIETDLARSEPALARLAANAAARSVA